ncbi:MAG: nuclear transport factor 2 family protein, partial [Pseudomonadota bacterium]|nr:nuclear transport factor 2 family protein [Pseudomonadota bacterium]
MAQTDPGRLHDILEIHALKAAYCRYVDTKQWRRLQALFTNDVVFEGFGSAPNGASLATFITGISSRFEKAVTVHHCHLPELAFNGPDQARGIWAMMDVVDLGDHGRP